MRSGRNRFASRLLGISAYFFADLNRQIGALRAAGHDVIRLDMGAPDQPPAALIVDALGDSANQAGNHSYQPFNGTPALRNAWVTLYRREFDVELDAERDVAVLLGSKEGIFHLTMACVDPGDVVLVPDPGYATYERSARFAGAEVVALPLRAERDYLPDLAAVPAEVAARARLMWLNFPNNPTGAVAPTAFFDEAVAFARRHDILLCHDAPYSLVTFDGSRAPSILAVPAAAEVAVEFNSLSKSHNMAGWRVGAALGNRDALDALRLLKSNIDSSHFLPIMEAATIALTGDQSWLAGRNALYQERRDLVVQALQRLGVTVQPPRAAIYVWMPLPAGWTALNFASALLAETAVSVTPGTVFGSEGEGYVRIALGAPTERIAAALDRLARWWRSRGLG